MNVEDAYRRFRELLTQQAELGADHAARDALIKQGEAILTASFPPPHPWPPAPISAKAKRDGSGPVVAYCFRCGAEVPGGLFIWNIKYKGRSVTYVNVDDRIGTRDPATGGHVPGHECSTMPPLQELMELDGDDDQAEPYTPPPGKWTEAEIAAARELADEPDTMDDWLENCTPQDLLDWIGGLVESAIDQHKHARDDRERAEAEAWLADIKRHLEAVLAARPDLAPELLEGQLELALT